MSAQRYSFTLSFCRRRFGGDVRVVSLRSIADCDVCSSCPSVHLEIEDQCWFYKAKDPVIKCSVSPVFGNIKWKRDNRLVANGGKLIGNEASQYQIWFHTSRTIRQEKLNISKHIWKSSLEHDSSFHCESQGYSSQTVSLAIPGNYI